MKKRIVLICIVLALCLLPNIASADDNIIAGNCGRQMKYSYDKSTCTLTLSGSGVVYGDFYFPEEIKSNSKKVIFVDYTSETLPPMGEFIALEEIHVPAGITELSGFSGCVKLKVISLPNTLRDIPYGCFNGCSSIERISIPESVESIGEYAFYGCSSLESISIPESMYSIGGYAFYGSGIKSIVIPNGVSSIGGCCFQNCKQLESVILPNRQDQSYSLDSYTFEGCENLKRIDIPICVYIIYGSCFANCSNLDEVMIPKTVGSIDDYAFDHSDKVTIVGAKGSTAEKYAQKIGIPFKEHEHIWNGEYTIDKRSTELEKGSESIHCSVCDAVNEETVRTIPRIKVNIGRARIRNIVETKTFTGKKITQTPVVTIGLRDKYGRIHKNVTLEEGKDYKLTYKNNKNVGKATVTITGIGDYYGSYSKTFDIIPKPTTMKSVSATKNGFTAKWKKMVAQTTGYELMYSTNSKFNSNTTIVRITKNKTLSKRVTNLKAKKKYYVKIRTYKKYKSRIYYSEWSKAKAVTTKN